MKKSLNLYTLTIGFFVWWYKEEMIEILIRSFYRIIWFSEVLRLDVMVQNLFVPLYQDKSLVGHIIGFTIRSIWIIFASIFELIFIFILGIFVCIWVLALPVAIFLLIKTIFNI